jgi:pimeloyl-ACP methyl ester carboxylesterase
VSAREQRIDLHGRHLQVKYLGSGPALLLLHGVTHSSATWDAVVERLAQRFTVVAPDLPGHGLSAKPPADYSLGEYASALRDMLLFLGLNRVSLVGHSLGGGVAMQFVYQFPEMCERMVLVSSGGLGRQLNPLLRLPTLPGSDWLLSALCSEWLSSGLIEAQRILARAGVRAGTDLREVWRGYLSLVDPDARRAFLQTLRGLVDLRGQRASALDRLYLAQDIPTLIIWGAKDLLIPVDHARAAHAAVVGSRLEVFDEAGHFPHLDTPERFISVLVDFMDSSTAASIDAQHFIRLARRRSLSPSSSPANDSAL